MELLQHIQEWVKGELAQAKIMITIGIIILVAIFYIYKSSNAIVNGTLIPVGLIIIALLGYGSFMFHDRNKRLSLIQKEYEQTSSISFDTEKTKIEEGIASCKITIRVWYALIVIGIGLFFFFTQPYYRGIGIGIALLGITLLLVDVFIDKRAKILYDIYTRLE